MKNKVKKLLKNNKVTFGSWITIDSPIIPELFSGSGFDWLCIDLEHSSIELSGLLNLIISIENNKMVPLVRVGENNPNLIKRVMDAGAHGVIIPNVKTAEDVQNAINYVKYPPDGKRGVGLFRAQKYGKNFDNYLEWLEIESIVIIQIENIDAVNNIDQIFKIPGIDAFIVGPYDLSGSLGCPGDFENPKVVSAIKKVLSAGKKYKITSGFHSVPNNHKEALSYLKMGFKFLGLSIDSILLSTSAQSLIDRIKKNV